MEKRGKRYLENGYLGLVVLFLYAPIFMLTALSFNAGRSRAHFSGFSLQWYAEMFQDEAILQALKNCIFVGLYRDCTGYHGGDCDSENEEAAEKSDYRGK